MMKKKTAPFHPSTHLHMPVPVIIEALAKYEGALSIRIVLTQSATHFLAGQSAEQPTVSSLLHLPNVDAVYHDRDEWGPQPWRRGASILHIECVASRFRGVRGVELTGDRLRRCLLPRVLRADCAMGDY